MALALTPMEILALIVVVFAAIKIIVLLINPKAWGSVVKAIYMQPVVTTIIALILAYLVAIYLLQELTIVQIFAAMLFTALVMVISIAAYSKDMIAMADKLLRDKNFLRRAWFPILVWVILVLWVLKAIFI